MTALVDKFALIGQSFQSDKFVGLQKAALAARAARRERRGDRLPRPWHPIDGAIILPKQLSA